MKSEYAGVRFRPTDTKIKKTQQNTIDFMENLSSSLKANSLKGQFNNDMMMLILTRGFISVTTANWNYP